MAKNNHTTFLPTATVGSPRFTNVKPSEKT